jgi:hypothetical protein
MAHPLLERELSPTGFSLAEELLAQIADRVELANHYYVAKNTQDYKGEPNFVIRPKAAQEKPKMASAAEIAEFVGAVRSRKKR